MKKNDLVMCRGNLCRIMDFKSAVPNMVTHVRLAMVTKEEWSGFIFTAKLEETRPLTKLELALK